MQYRVIKIICVVCLLITLLLVNGCRKISPSIMNEEYFTPTSVTMSHNPKSVEELPEQVQEAHYEWSRMLLLTWFDNSSVNVMEYDKLVLDFTGKFAHVHTTVMSERLTQMGQLTSAQQAAIRDTLENMTAESSTYPLSGSRFITLGFVWQGQGYLLSFSNTNCSNKLQHLLSIFDTAWGYTLNDAKALQHLCEKNNPQTSPTTSDPITSTLTKLPKVIYDNYVYPHLLCVTWFQQPFSGSYYQISLYDNNLLYYEKYEENKVAESISGWLTDADQNEVRTILAEIRSDTYEDLDLHTSIITVSFPWEADYYLVNFGDRNCPEALQRLMELMEATLARGGSEIDDIQIPCLEK